MLAHFALQRIWNTLSNGVHKDLLLHPIFITSTRVATRHKMVCVIFRAITLSSLLVIGNIKTLNGFFRDAQRDVRH